MADNEEKYTWNGAFSKYEKQAPIAEVAKENQ